ncbi:uncharacterized protein LOC121735002 [Aricia agestis]|uniref:uncharacterized protein LOC121735002 n=1 Tax=Aricia agestis TaxID=91739 RepID=UPI001C20BD04|nr:uncharacterized protein LOC121735002 [Aricia agestis]
MTAYKALTQFSCDEIGFKYNDNIMHNPYFRQTVLGCKVLQVLQDLYRFNLTYVLVSSTHNSSQTGDHFYQSLIPPVGDVDVYVKPLSISKYILETAFPIQPIFNWRVGFILRDDYNYDIQRFYTLPFTRVVWCCIVLMVVVGSSVFYVLSWWERRLLGNGECSFVYEIFIAVSAVCQHILPFQANLSSRRIAYLYFILGTYIIHCFYTSNLLSRLVSDRDGLMDLEELADSDYEIAVLKDMNLSAQHKLTKSPMDKNLSIIFKKIQHTKHMDVKPALDAVMYKRTALVTDFVTVYPLFKKYYSTHEICDLIEIDIYSNIQHYLVTSKTFKLKEEFRIGVLRLRENGMLQVMSTPPTIPFACHEENINRRAELEQMGGPVVLLLASFILAFAILALEKIHYERNKVFPYVN